MVMDYYDDEGDAGTRIELAEKKGWRPMTKTA